MEIAAFEFQMHDNGQHGAVATWLTSNTEKGDFLNVLLIIIGAKLSSDRKQQQMRIVDCNHLVHAITCCFVASMVGYSPSLREYLSHIWTCSLCVFILAIDSSPPFF